MIHLTLQSYYDDKPVDPNDDQHPDGLLWPATEAELADMPNGTYIEDIETGETTILTSNTSFYAGRHYGVRGRREEEMV